MKILERNPENNGWTIEAFCTGKGWHQNGKIPCGAKLEITDIDIRARKYTDISGCTEVYYGFICPICGCYTEIPENKIPEEVKNIAIKKPFYEDRGEGI